MADKLSVGSSQVFLATLVDLNNMPVAASAIHLEGRLYTSAKSKWDFETNMGATKGCEIFNDMLLIKVDPKLSAGNMRVYTMVHTGSAVDKVGITDAENDQPLDISIVSAGTYIASKQGPIGIIIKLNTIISDKSQLPWSLPGQSVQAIKDEMTKYMSSPEFIQALKTVGSASSDLSNVDTKNFEAKGKDANFAQNDLADIDLQKLAEKGNAAGLGFKNLSNIPLNIFNRFVRQSAAYKKLASMPHPATSGKTDEQIKALFYSNHYEEQNAVDLSQAPYNASTTLMLAFQMSDAKAIAQTLPPIASNQIVWVEIIRQNDAKNYTVTISPAQGDSINGSALPIVLDEGTPEGLFIPINNERTWEFIPYHRYGKLGLSGQDDFGTLIDSISNLYFKKPLKLRWNAGTEQVEVSVEGDMEMSFLDTVLKQTFKSAFGQSVDGSIRISMIPRGKDADGTDIYGVDFSVAKTPAQEGVARVAEFTQLINFAYPDEKPKFSNVLYHGGAAVYIENSNDSIVVQEIDGKDPNITGGTLFLCILDYSPDKSQDNTLTQDGKITLALVDEKGDYIPTITGGYAAVERTYKAGQKVEDMRLAVLFEAKNYQEVFYSLTGEFDQEEAVSLGLSSGMCIQAIEPNNGFGDALQIYEMYTGSRVEIGKINYSTNNINFARVVAKDSIVIIGGDTTDNLGNNLYFDARSSISKQITNYGLRVQATRTPCEFSLYKVYSKVDLIRLKDHSINMRVELMNKQGAMRLVKMGYKGTDPTTSPKLMSFVNSQAKYNAGWEEIEDLFIAEDTLSDKHEETITFTFPSVDDGYTACAFLLRPNSEATPVDVTIFDMEGDITPGFTFAAIKEQYSPGQMSLVQRDLYTKSAIICPLAYESYRFTINNTPTKLPVGIFKQNGFVKNNNAWYDSGSAGKEFQGDIEILKSFNGSLSYTLNAYNEKTEDSNVTVWLARVEADGTFTKIPESELTVTVKANTLPTTVNQVVLPAFSHAYKKGESYRWFAQSNKADGAFVQCSNGSHIPMTEIIIHVEYYSEIPEDIIHANGLAKIQFVDGSKEVKDPENYTIQIDIKTNAIKVVKK